MNKTMQGQEEQGWSVQKGKYESIVPPGKQDISDELQKLKLKFKIFLYENAELLTFVEMMPQFPLSKYANAS